MMPMRQLTVEFYSCLCEVRFKEGGDNCIILKLFELIGGSQFCEGNAELVG